MATRSPRIESIGPDDQKKILNDGIALLTKQLNCDGRVDPEVDDVHFPGADLGVNIGGVVPVLAPGVRSFSEVAAYLADLVPPMQPVMPDKGIKWAAKNPAEAWSTPLAIVGQQWRDDSDGVSYILVLRRHVLGRGITIKSVESPLGMFTRILAEPKKAAGA